MNPFKSHKRVYHCSVRRGKQFRFKKAAKLRESIGVVQSKKLLKTGFLNVDGLNDVSREDVSDTIKLKKIDVVFIVESKRREEEIGIDISIPGYAVHEAKRSNLAEDKDGGGLVCYTKLGDGLLFQRHTFEPA